MQQIYRRTPILKSDFKQLYWNHTSTWLFSCKFAAFFQNTFFMEQLSVDASDNLNGMKQKYENVKEMEPVTY